MRGLDVPEQSEDFTADPVELFFDLAFVFAFSQIVHLLVVHPDWQHVGKAGLVFLLLWAAWSQFTWSANAVPGNQRSVRLVFLIATAASVPMAAAVETAFDGTAGLVFAIPLALIFLLANTLLVMANPRGTSEFASAVRYSVPNVVAMVTLVAGGFVDGGTRSVLWIAAFLIVLSSTIRAGAGDFTIRPGHFAERHALIIIIALGEVIVALGRAVAEPLAGGSGFDATAIVALAATGVAAGALWWSYFDRVQPSLEHRFEDLQARERSRFAREVYTYSHMPIVAGVILIAVGLERAALHPDEPLAVAYRMLWLAGISLFIIGISLGIRRAFRLVPYERIAGVGAVALLMGFAGSLHAVWLIVIVVTAAVIGLIIEHLRIEVRPSS